MTEQEATQSATVKAVVAGLIALVRAAPTAKIQAIAGGDRHACAGDNARHFKALREVVDDLECRLDRQSDNSWFPREPVELVSYGVDGHDVEVVAVANALLMISELETDRFDYMGIRWSSSPGEAYFRALPQTLSRPLLEGFQLLHERAEKRGW